MQTKTSWPLVMIVAGAGFTAAFNIGKVAPVLPLIQAEMGLELSDLGLVVSVYSLLSMLLCVPIAIAGAQFGNYRTAVLALGLMGCGGLISAHADGLSWLLFGRIVEGFGFVMIAVAGPALIARAVLPQDRPMGMTVWSLWLPVGVSSMLLISPTLIDLADWRLPWSLTGWFALFWMVILALAFLKVGRSGDKQRGITKQQIRGIFQPGTLMMALGLGIFSSLYTVGIAFSPTIWHETKQVSLQTGSYLLAIAIFSTVFGNLVGGYFIKRGYPLNRLLVIGFVIPSMLCSLVFVQALPFWFQYTCFMIFAVSVGIIPAAIFAKAPAYTTEPIQISLAIALVFQGTTAGQVIGPIVFSNLIEGKGGDWSWGLVYALSIAVIGGLVMYSIKPPKAV